MNQFAGRPSVVRRLFAVVLFAGVAAQARAQGVTPMSGDASVNVGFNNVISQIINKYNSGVSTGISKDYFEFGFAGGVNLSKQATVLAEYNFLPLASSSGSGYSEHIHENLFGGAVRYAPITYKNVSPYLVGGGGLLHFTVSASGSGTTVSSSNNGGYVGFGAGASIYAKKNWGLRPEFRYQHQGVTVSGTSYSLNTVSGTVALFYQFGGK